MRAKYVLITGRGEDTKLRRIALAGLVLAAGAALPQAAGPSLTVDYPQPGTVFPAEIAAPTFLWRDSSAAARWHIRVEFSGVAAPVEITSAGEPPAIGEIDPRAIGPNNEPPRVAPEQRAHHSWRPDAATWETIKRNSRGGVATITITGAGSEGRVAIETSTDPVAAPIFYRDVPLMPSEVERGVIKPLAESNVPLIAWRLRNVAEPRSRLLLEGLHTCANCHSFSADGKTLGMDVDGPENDKGTYAIVPVQPRSTIRTEDVITWNSFRAKPPGQHTIGFLSQISPDGRYAVTTLNESVYVANFRDYRFLQVFYPTRGILAWYDRQTGRMEALPGADDPRYVHTDAVWSPDGEYLVFARAEARDPYPPGSKLAEYANDPNETPMRYDLYRIPFHGGKGGRAEPIAGASRNGMSNTFPKVSPDGRWIVYVQCRNGQLMRPDSQLYIVPAGGGEARRMRANTALMNSWHSFSPNGRWLVFSSKSRSPYTQMYLTHLDAEGRDSPPVLIENATAANRAVNIPEFVNIAPDGLEHIEVPAAEYYRLFDSALALRAKGQLDAAIAEWGRALALNPDEPKAHNNLGVVLGEKGDAAAAIAQFRKAVALRPGYGEAHYNLGAALAREGKLEAAIAQFREAAALNGEDAQAHNDLGVALLQTGKTGEAIAELRRAVAIDPKYAEAYNNLGVALVRKGSLAQAEAAFRQAAEAKPGYAEPYYSLGAISYSQGKTAEALARWRAGLSIDPGCRPILYRLSWVLATSPDIAVRNGADAVRLAERLVAREPDAQALDAMGAALAENGRFQEASDAAATALRLARAAGNRALADAVAGRMALYRKRSPYHEKP